MKKRYLRYCFCLSLWSQFMTVNAQQKPNILWITIEDTSPEFIGSYGNKAARTPNIDQLAKEGVQFSNAFSTGTVCSPSRTAIITGVKTYCTGTGHHRSAIPLPAFIKGFPWYMQQAGYYTTNSSKTDYNVADEAGFTKATWNESSGRAGWWNRRPGQPFFAVFNFNASHQSNTMTNPYEQYKKAVLEHLDKKETIGDDAFEMPPFYRNSPEMRKEVARVYNSLSLTDKRIGELLERLKADGLMDSTIIIFYGDHGQGIPRGKTNGINFGFRVPFVIWFPEMYKHLSPWGTEKVTDELVDFSDLAPSMLSLAGCHQPEHMTGRAFIGADRKKAPNYLILSSDRSDNGIDLVRAVTDGRYFYAKNFMPYMPQLRYIRYMEIGAIKQIMRNDFENGLLDSLQKSLLEPRAAEFLFDTKADPWETTNLSEQRQQRSRLMEMRAQLGKELVSKKDIMLLPEGEMVAISQRTNPYEFRLKESDYPVHTIYKAAALSGFRDSRSLKQQVTLLGSSNKILRYWAITGLFSHPDAGLKPYLATIRQAMNDDYAPAAATGAALLYRLNGSKEAIEKMKTFILGSNEHWALLTINYLLYSSHKEPFIEAIRQCRLLSGRSYATKAACMDFLGSLKLVPNDINNRQ